MPTVAKPKKLRSAKSHRHLPSTQIRDAALKRYFGDMEVVEATKDLHLQPQLVDIETAQRDDPANCAFSRACQRMYGSSYVLFFGTIAYVDLLDGSGARKVNRFIVGPEARSFIKRFDSGENVAPGGFRLSPPAPSKTLNGNLKYKENRAARRREALLKGEAYQPDQRFRHGGMKRPEAKRFRNFRDGTGMVHFPKSTAPEAA